MKKILISIGLIVILFLNIVVTFADNTTLTECSGNENISINDQGSGSGGSNMLPEATAKPGEIISRCYYQSGFSFGGSIGFPNGVSVSYSVSYTKGTEVRCTSRGNGCIYRACS